MVAVDEGRAQAIVETAIRERERLHNGHSRRSALVTLTVPGGIGLLPALLIAGGSPGAAPTCDGRTTEHTRRFDRMSVRQHPFPLSRLFWSSHRSLLNTGIGLGGNLAGAGPVGAMTAAAGAGQVIDAKPRLVTTSDVRIKAMALTRIGGKA